MALTPRPVGQMLEKHRLIEVGKIGQGSFGQAVLCQASDGSKVVCKVIDVRQASVKERQEAQKEGQLLASLRHPYIVRYRDMFIDEGCLCILMAFCEGGDLKSRVEEASVAKRHIPEDQILVWMCQALLALAYVHGRRVLHRDLKSSNFFLSKGGSLKMGDFGIAKVLGSTAALAQTMIGTPHFLSPEVCQGRPYAWPSDIWAMGCVLHELCALRVPFNAPDIVRLVTKVCAGPLPPIPDRYSGFVRQLLGDMLNRSQGQRPSAEAILHRPPMQARVRRLLEQAQAAPSTGTGSSGSDDLSGGSAPARLAEGDLTRLCAELGIGAALAGAGAGKEAGGADEPSATALLEQELDRMAAEEAAKGIGPFRPAARGGDAVAAGLRRLGGGP